MTDNIAQAIREAITDAVRAGLGHAIMLIEEYGIDNDDARPHCDRLAATLRHQSASVGVDGTE
jgi:agmatine/peptidylarginine deiminase